MHRNSLLELVEILPESSGQWRPWDPVVEVLHRLIGHEAHHKGQLMLYSRMLGVKTPFYVDLSV
jgi:uncharacterized damage-inducible protein DinB